MEFYQELHRVLPSETHIIAVFPDTEDMPRQDLPESLRDIDVLAGVDLETLGVFGTPTVILADGAGVVQRVWRGRLSEELEKEVRVALNVAP